MHAMHQQQLFFLHDISLRLFIVTHTKKNTGIQVCPDSRCKSCILKRMNVCIVYYYGQDQSVNFFIIYKETVHYVCDDMNCLYCRSSGHAFILISKFFYIYCAMLLLFLNLNRSVQRASKSDFTLHTVYT
jgi:hypothetical protein